MTVKISNKIVGYRVKKADAEQPAPAAAPMEAKPVRMNETIERPDFLLGTTYKIKPPVASFDLKAARLD